MVNQIRESGNTEREEERKREDAEAECERVR